MTTTRKNNTPVLTNRAAFEEAVNAVAQTDIELRALTAEMDAELQNVRDRYAARIEALATYRNNTKELCEAYAKAHKDEVLKPGLRSGETALASYGFHLGKPQLVLLNRRHKWSTVLEAIRERGLTWVSKYITTKTTTQPNKDALKADLSDAELATLGLRIEQADSFDIAAKDNNAPEN